MTTTGMIIVFAAVMCLIAMLAIGVDWIGKPIRNRKFVPRIYRYADESELRVQQAAMPAQIPAGLAPAALPAAGETGLAAPLGTGSSWLNEGGAFGGPGALQPLPYASRPEPPPGPPATSFAELVALETFPGSGAAAGTHLSTQPASPDELFDTDTDTDTGPLPRLAAVADQPSSASRHKWSIDPSSATSEPGIWEPGDPIWGPTRDQERPSRKGAERRFWQSSLVLSGASEWLGDDNVERMRSGQAPRRWNHLTGTVESMEVVGLEPPASAFNTDAEADSSDTWARWPGNEIDPFQS